MLSHLFQVSKTCSQLLEKSGHPSEGGSLQHLASVERVSIFEHSYVVIGNIVDYRFGLVHVSQSQFVVVFVVEYVQLVCVERMDVVELGEAIDNSLQFFIDSGLSELDLSHIEPSDSIDLKLLVDFSRSLSVRFGEDNVNKG